MSLLIVTAGRIEGIARDLRDRTTSIRRSAARARWHSPGARAFRGQLDELVGQLSECARDLDTLARLLRDKARK